VGCLALDWTVPSKTKTGQGGAGGSTTTTADTTTTGTGSMGAPCDGGNQCPNHFSCATSMICNTACSSAGDAGDGSCPAGYYCDGVGAGACQQQLVPGAPCSANDQCLSGICGTNGTGNCCTAPCTNGGQCGTTGCSNTGACVYPVDNPCPSG